MRHHHWFPKWLSELRAAVTGVEALFFGSAVGCKFPTLL